MLARVLVLLFVGALAVWLAGRRTDPLLAARWVLLVALLLAPQVHPWYLLWLLPLEAASGRFSGIVWSAAILVAYAPLEGWLAGREWHESMGARVLEYGLVALALLIESRPLAEAEKQPDSAPIRLPFFARRG
jgi:hypothetical protein